MRPIREAVNQPIRWSGRWEYELRSGADVIGTLRIKEKVGRTSGFMEDPRFLRMQVRKKD